MNIFKVGEFRGDVLARHISTLPGRYGGLGLRSAVRSAVPAYWASWVDCLPVIANRNNDLAVFIVQKLQGIANDGIARDTVGSNEASMPECLIELQGAQIYLASIIEDGLPSWQDIIEGIEAPKPEMGNDPGE